MFDESLLESSPSRAPVLAGKHWFISFVVGALGMAAGYFILPPNDMKIVLTQAILFFALPPLATSLMLCYVYADTRHLGLRVGLWMTITVLLNLVGFVIYLVYTAAKTENWKRATFPLAYMLESIVIGLVVLVPLMKTEALPTAQLMTFLVAPPPPPPPPPPPAAAPVRIIHRVTAEDLMKAPTVIPKTINPVKDEPERPPQAAVGVVGGVPGGMPGGSPGGVLGSILTANAPPPPPKPTTPKRIRVGGDVESARLIFQPKPEYPPLAKMARIQGVVKLEAIINKDGTIQDLKVIQGHPLLVKAATDAVAKWRYQPTLLNGEPVDVVTEIDVNFTLSE